VTLTGKQLAFVQTALHHGADEASAALSRWIGRPAHIDFDELEQLPIEEATSVLGASEEPISCCTAQMTGRLTGHLVLAFDDESGLALADMLVGQPRGHSRDWTEMEKSAALETTNIRCCAYLNALLRALPAVPGAPEVLLPTPPRFARDFPESLLQFALMDQMVTSDEALLARTRFHIDGAPVDWTLLFVPDAESMAKLSTGPS
jgi:chemotaxis protein CheC